MVVPFDAGDELQPFEALLFEEFIEEFGLSRSGLDRLIEQAYRLLNLITFYTVANNKLRAWAVTAGACAPEAAGKVHTDMERGFVRAQVAPYSELVEHGSMQALHRLGAIRTEGRSYQVQDGDVIEFLFATS